MQTNTSTSELGRFLRARRAALSPESVGLSSGQRRRTPGLRREEVAILANVGLSWYTWLEQGRDINASTETLDRIAAALRLSSSDTAYVHRLAATAQRAETTTRRTLELDSRVQLALDAIKGGPAVLTNSRFDVVAFNALADLIYRFDDYEGPFPRNHMWRAFMDPARRRLYRQCWDSIGPWFVGVFRTNYASNIGDAAFEELLTALRQQSPDFETEWNAQRTAAIQPAIPLPLDSRHFGLVKIHSVRFLLPDLPGYLMFVGPAADERTAALFARVELGESKRRDR